MRRKAILTLAVTVALLVGATSVAAAQPGDGPSSELPDPVPDFVTDVLGAISDFVGAVGDSLGEIVRSITPGEGGAVTMPAPDA
ncbi:hypothetical protein ACYJ1Y_02395 [Natrialbaceae archaeon A-gly3]